jgi:hypothetical protein
VTTGGAGRCPTSSHSARSCWLRDAALPDLLVTLASWPSWSRRSAPCGHRRILQPGCPAVLSACTASGPATGAKAAGRHAHSSPVACCDRINSAMPVGGAMHAAMGTQCIWQQWPSCAGALKTDNAWGMQGPRAVNRVMQRLHTSLLCGISTSSTGAALRCKSMQRGDAHSFQHLQQVLVVCRIAIVVSL